MSGTKDFRILVYISAVDDSPNPEGTTVDFTITNDYLDDGLYIGGQRVDVREGTTESLGWSATVNDFSEFFTGNMTDGAGRMNVAGRFVRAQENINSGGWNTVWAGRLVDVDEDAGPGQYQIRFVDERFLERGVEIYKTADTSQLSPAGTKVGWKYLPPAGTGSVIVDTVTSTDVLLALNYDSPISASVLDLLEQDLKVDSGPGASDGITGNFTKLRATVDGIEYEVVSLSGIISQDPLNDLEVREEELEEDGVNKIFYVWVAWDGIQTTTAQPNEGDIFNDFVLTLDDVETAEAWPLHIGGTAGVDPIQELKDRYDEFGIRYNSDIFDTWNASTNPQGLIAHPLIPLMWFRLEESKNLLEWGDLLFSALGLITFINTDGEIAPRFMFHQHDVDPTTLTELTDDDIAEPVTFNFKGSEAITVITPSYLETNPARIPGVRQVFGGSGRVDAASDWAADLLETHEVTLPEYTHDRVDNVGRRNRELHVPGEFTSSSLAKRFFEQQSTEIFDRFGDGPAYGTIVGMSSVDALAPGEWFRLTVENYPIITTGARDGSTLVCQIVEKRRDPEGPTTRFLTGGPDDQPLSAPTVSIATNGTRPKHDVDITVGSLDAAADKYQLQIKVGSGPWFTAKTGTANGTVTIRNLPSNTTIQTRARATALDTIRSAWSSVDSVSTDALTAPSAASATASGLTIRLTWTNGESAYPIMLTLDGVDFLQHALSPGTTAWTFMGLDASTLYTVGVKHIDRYGGESAADTDTATTGTAGTLADPANFRIRQGALSDDARLGFTPTWTLKRSPRLSEVGNGVELAWDRTDYYATTVVEYDTASGFSAPTRVSAGTAESIRISLPIDDTVYYFRIRHESEDGTEVSSWVTDISSTSAQAVPFVDPSPPAPSIVQASLTGIPIADSGTRGVYIDLHVEVSGRVTGIGIVFHYDDGSAQNVEYTSVVAVTPGQDNVERLQFSGDFIFEETWTDLSVDVFPITAQGLIGAARVVAYENVEVTGVGVRAALTAGGTAMSDYFVPGTNVTVTTDANGRIEINAVTGAGAALDDLSDVTITAAINLDVLAHNGSNWADVALTTSHIQSGTFDNARIAESNVTQHQAALAIAASQITSGTLGVARGGTGLSTLTGVGRVLVSTGATALAAVDSGASAGYLRSNGTTWVRSAIQTSDITSGMVTQHEASLSIAASQVTAGTLGAGAFTTSGIFTVNVNGDTQLRLSHQSTTGSPRLSFRQTTTRRSYIQHMDTGDVLRIAAEYGSVEIWPGSGGTEALALTVENGGDVTAEGDVLATVP